MNNLIIWDFGFMVVTNIYKTVNTINNKILENGGKTK